MKQLDADIEAKAKPIIEARSVKFAQQLARGQDLIGAWGRAALFGTFLLAGVGGCRTDRSCLDRTAIQMAGRKERGDRRTDCRPASAPSINSTVGAAVSH